MSDVARLLISRTIGAAVLGVGIAVVAPAATAHAYYGDCAGNATHSSLLTVTQLRVDNNGDGSHLVQVEVHASMPPGDAQKFIDRPGGEGHFNMWGDDEWDDDLMVGGMPYEHYWVHDGGLGMRGATLVPDGVMNEDAAPDPGAIEDEWYVGAHFDDIRTGQHHKVQSCTLGLAF